MQQSFSVLRNASGSSNAGPVAISSVILGAWTGRDAEAREKHIAELELIGVARPSRVPAFYRIPVDRLTRDDRIEVVGPNTSGEVEVVTFVLDDGIWIGLGSDHTDREVEAYSVSVSKQLCPKPIAGEVWRLDDIADHWDRLVLRAHAVTDRRRRVYQEGDVSGLLSPSELAAALSGGLAALPKGTALFGGTLPVVGEIGHADRFEIEMIDPVANRTIRHAYQVECLPPEG